MGGILSNQPVTPIDKIINDGRSVSVQSKKLGPSNYTFVGTAFSLELDKDKKLGEGNPINNSIQYLFIDICNKIKQEDDRMEIEEYTGLKYADILDLQLRMVKYMDLEDEKRYNVMHISKINNKVKASITVYSETNKKTPTQEATGNTFAEAVKNLLALK